MPLAGRLLRLGVGGFELGRAVELENRVDALDSLWVVVFFSATANSMVLAAA
jgi:hypothetical protein